MLPLKKKGFWMQFATYQMKKMILKKDKKTKLKEKDMIMT
jgi:hypothetical protein